MVMHVLHFSLSSLTCTAWIRVYYSGCQEADPWYPFQTAIQSVLKLTGQDVFDQTHRHMMNFLAVIHFSLRNTVRVIGRKPLLLKVQNDIPFIMHEKSVTVLVFLERRWLYIVRGHV